MLVAGGRITMLGLSRWTGKGGRYRTIQRLYHTVLPWSAIQWCFFRKQFLKADDEYLIAGDEVVDSKAGKETYGLDRFFSGIEQRVIPGLSFFALSLINVREEHSYPLQIEQIIKSAEEKCFSDHQYRRRSQRNRICCCRMGLRWDGHLLGWLDCWTYRHTSCQDQDRDQDKRQPGQSSHHRIGLPTGNHRHIII